MRKTISLKRLFMLAVGYCKTKKQMEEIASFLKYVNINKNKEL